MEEREEEEWCLVDNANIGNSFLNSKCEDGNHSEAVIEEYGKEVRNSVCESHYSMEKFSQVGLLVFKLPNSFASAHHLPSILYFCKLHPLLTFCILGVGTERIKSKIAGLSVVAALGTHNAKDVDGTGKSEAANPVRDANLA